MELNSISPILAVRLTSKSSAGASWGSLVDAVTELSWYGAS